MNHSRFTKLNGFGLKRTIRSEKISNMKALETDFAKSVSFGKASPKSPEEIKKKFSI